MSGSSRSSSRAIDIEEDLSIDWEIDAVFEHFKTQIENQGWELDSENTGSASAVGTWTRSPEAGLDLIGNLIVLKSGDESFDLKFQLNPVGAGNSNSGLRVIR